MSAITHSGVSTPVNNTCSACAPKKINFKAEKVSAAVAGLATAGCMGFGIHALWVAAVAGGITAIFTGGFFAAVLIIIALGMLTCSYLHGRSLANKEKKVEQLEMQATNPTQQVQQKPVKKLTI